MEISESQTVGSGPERTVEIMLSTNTLSGISGHDFNTDGVWDEITWCGYDTNRSGANSYVRTKKGWKWQPCDIDKKYAPINEAEIANAIKSLDAVLTNRSINNLKRVWTYNSTTDLSR
jgi:hypothetical protein